MAARGFFWSLLLLLGISVMESISAAAWVLEHADGMSLAEELAGLMGCELALIGWYVYSLYITSSYVKAVQEGRPCMNGTAVPLESIAVHGGAPHVSTGQPKITVMATPIQGHIAAATGIPTMGTAAPSKPSAACAPAWARPVPSAGGRPTAAPKASRSLNAP